MPVLSVSNFVVSILRNLLTIDISDKGKAKFECQEICCTGRSSVGPQVYIL